MTESPKGTVRSSDDGAVRTLRIDNPRARNGLDDDTRRALRASLLSAMTDESCRVIVLTGANDTFCAGGELASMPTHDRPAIDARLGEMHDIVRTIVLGAKPVVAAVEGYAYGSGLSLVAASDHVVASRTSSLCASFRRVGLAPDTALGWTLPRRVGTGAALELVLFAEPIDAGRAHQLGLVDELVDSGRALEHALARAQLLASAAPGALSAAKALVSRASDPLETFLDAELDAQRTLLATDDFAEGRTAFFQRREATFHGR